MWEADAEFPIRIRLGLYTALFSVTQCVIIILKLNMVSMVNLLDIYTQTDIFNN